MLILILAIFTMITSPSVKAKNTSQHHKPYGGTVKWGVYTKPTIINPLLTTSSVSIFTGVSLQ
jgi:NADH:ubiquinone oxidoreductase subunit F (NADH-binding)